jgi:hypothetical protein
MGRTETALLRAQQGLVERLFVEKLFVGTKVIVFVREHIFGERFRAWGAGFWQPELVVFSGRRGSTMKSGD